MKLMSNERANERLACDAQPPRGGAQTHRRDASQSAEKSILILLWKKAAGLW